MSRLQNSKTIFFSNNEVKSTVNNLMGSREIREKMLKKMETKIIRVVL